MSLEALLDDVARDAGRQARGILAQARDEARRIVREAEERVAEELGNRLQGRETDLRQAAARRLAVAEREARAFELGARERYFKRVFAAVRVRLAAPKSCNLLRTGLGLRVTRLLTYVPQRPVTFHCWPAMAPEVQEALGDLDGVDVLPDAVSPTGLTLEGCAGAVQIDDSLERRLDALAKALRIELAREVPEES